MAPSSSPSAGRAIRGVVVLDGAVNGCGGEHILITVRESASDVATYVAESDLEGLDCVYHFAVPVPRLDCYLLNVDGTQIGGYSYDWLKDNGFNVGYIASESVWGDPDTGEGPQANKDWFGCAEG